jgi:hypothetical protein
VNYPLPRCSAAALALYINYQLSAAALQRFMRKNFLSAAAKKQALRLAIF